MNAFSSIQAVSRFVRDFARARRGATAVEFSIVLVPFLMLLLGIVELALLFTGSVALDNAVQIASRKVRTGEMVTPSDSGQIETSRVAFRDEICGAMGFLENDCKSKLSVDVRSETAFSDITLTDPVQDGVFDPGSLTFDTGGASSIVVVRAYYRWTLFAPLMNQALVRMPGESLLTSVTTFRTEPYDQ